MGATAVQKISEQNRITQIAKTALLPNTRIAALNKLTVQNSIAYIVSNVNGSGMESLSGVFYVLGLLGFSAAFSLLALKANS